MEEKDVIERIRRGDSRLYATVVKRYSAQIFSKVLSLVKREDMAEEVTQQTFVRVYTRLDDWRGQSLGAWIMVIAMHLALNELDKERRRKTLGLEETARRRDGGSANPYDKYPYQNEEYSDGHEALLQRLEDAIAELRPDDQAIIKLHYYEKRSAEDIASRLNMSKGNVLVRLHRVREQLKKRLNNGNDR